MFREEKPKTKTKTINIVLMDGGVGDHIASLVAVNYICETYPWVTVLLWLPDFLVDFAKNVLPETVKTRGFSQMRGQYDPSKPTKTTKWDGNTSPMKIHCVDYAFLRLCDELVAVSKKNYLQVKLDQIKSKDFDLPDKYVVITTGFTAEVREFLPLHVNTIAQFVKNKGYEPVFLGQRQTVTGAAHVIQGEFKADIDFSAGINLIDQTTLLEAAAIMAHAAAVVGVDNGLLHIAGCTKVPIVGGFTTVSPWVRMPVRAGIVGRDYYPIVPDESLGCTFCQQRTNFLYGHDYKTCLYKDNLCVKQMTANKFINVLEGLLV